MLPKQREVQVPLLEVLVEIDGQGKSKDIHLAAYDQMA
jgi:hypothetical protein